MFICKTKRGHGRGKELGFRTINCDIPTDFQYQHGIYAGWVKIGETAYPAAIHYGPIPAFADPEPSLEAHLINAELSERPQQIELELTDYIRPIKDFPSQAALAEQIARDVKDIKKVLNSSR